MSENPDHEGVRGLVAFPYDESMYSPAEDQRDWRAEVTLSATNQHEAGRMPRLHRAWGRIQAMVAQLSDRYRIAFAGAVSRLHDHKGELEVTWRDAQARIMFEGVVIGAWEAEGEPNHMHHLGFSDEDLP
jgi:hypothetical protein